jgi:adenine deaminase
LKDYPDSIMFGSDDKHPDSLVNDHINALCARAVAKGHDVFDVLQAACINPIDHYGLSCGSLREGEPADFILLKDLTSFEVTDTYINGLLVARNGKTLLKSVPVNTINQFNCSPKNISDFAYTSPLSDTVPVIRAMDGQLITLKEDVPLEYFPRASGVPSPNVEKDLLKLVVVNRYQDKPIAVSFITGFGLKQGALASSVAHDSHNIVAVGADDESICLAVNEVIRHKGAISIAGPEGVSALPLPVAGLMSETDGYQVAAQYERMDLTSKAMGSTLRAPFMTLSFMALLVIPHLKLSDKGLFDGDRFQFVFSGS